ncbi:MAG: hypothetical protein R2795_02690 [Saprospiraceae bacterium]
MQNRAIIYLIAMGLIGFITITLSGCKCFGDDCSITVPKILMVAVRDSSTGNLLPATEYTVTVNVAGVDWPSRVRFDPYSTNTDDYYYYTMQPATDDMIFSTVGNYEAIVQINGQERCRLSFVLTSTICCNDYPQDGRVSLTSGQVEFLSSGYPQVDTPRIIIPI